MNLKTDGTIFHETLTKEIEYCYPWQYKDYNVKDVVLVPIEPDIKVYWNETSVFRKGYEVDHDTKTIYIPHFLLKINGHHKTNKEYINFVKFLCESKNSKVYHELYVSTSKNLSNTPSPKSTKLKDWLKECKEIDFSSEESSVRQYIKIILNDNGNKKDSNFNNIIIEKQIQLINIFEEYITKNLKTITIREFDELISTLLYMPNDIIILLNNFDYSSDIPKLIFENCKFSKENSFLIELLSKIGFDIIILEPSGSVTIEKYININTISLGYFEKDYNIEDKTKSKLDKTREVITGMDMEDVVPIAYLIYLVISLILMIVFMFTQSGFFNTIYQILIAFITIIATAIFSAEGYLDTDDIIPTIGIVYIVLIFLFMFGRGVCSIQIEEWVDTTTYTGTLDIADNVLETKNDYTMESKKDAVIVVNTNEIYLYIENDQENDVTMDFAIYDNDSKLYSSSYIEPYEYVTNIILNDNCFSEVGTEKLTIKYYSNQSTGELGSQSIILHIIEEDDLEETLKLYNLE